MLRHKKLIQGLVGLFVVTLLTTSFGGAFATAASAAAIEKEHDSNKGLIGGLLAVGLLAILTKGGGGDKGGAAPKPVTPGNNSSDEKVAVELMNQDRAENGLPPLKVNSSLTRLAGNYAQDMINRGFFSHYNPEGKSPFDRMQAAGIGYKTAGENLAINSSVAAAEKAFMNSSGHRANILNSTYTDVGIGVRYNAKGQAYVVQEFISQ
jgi:uncharacterized protein YkwD